MLFTRCPDCDTTFRITADALGKADGQVRCGRCACVFNAYSELREQRASSSETEQITTVTGSAAAESDHAKSSSELSAEPIPEPAADESDHDAAAGEAAGEPDPYAAAGEPTAVPDAAPAEIVLKSMAPLVPLPSPNLAPHDISFGGFTVASIMEQIASSAVDDDAKDTASAVSGTARVNAQGSDLFDERLVDSVLEGRAPEAAPPAWQLITDEPRNSSRRWIYACVAAFALLALQMTHHFRADIAGMALVGPLLQNSYALFGVEIVPQWHLEQYEIVDWVATAEPNASGEGSLKITARIQNKGPKAQPYPFVHVRLNDRWEEEIGNRIFGPAEYLRAPAKPESLMAPGATARAELEVVDPGPDAYGFELDVCVRGEAESLRCSADAVFPSM